MPSVDDLLTELDRYQWFCSPDAANEFWAVMMTEQARHGSAFLCSLDILSGCVCRLDSRTLLGSIKNSSTERCGGLVQAKGDWQGFATKIKVAEDEIASKRATKTIAINEFGLGGPALTKLEADYRALDESDPLRRLVNDLARQHVCHRRTR